MITVRQTDATRLPTPVPASTHPRYRPAVGQTLLMRITRFIALPTCLAASVALANAQVVYGTDNANDMDNYLLDVVTDVSMGPLFSGQELFGLADDDPNQLLYASEEGMVASWSYGSAAPAAVVVAPIDPANGNSIRCEALVFDSNTLYGVDEFGAAGQEGIYSFDLVTGDATPVAIYIDTTLDIGGMDIDPGTGLFYGSSDAGAAQGITEIDAVANTETIISAYTGGAVDIDGLAFDPAGNVYLIQDEAAPIDVYNIASAMYTGTRTSSIAVANVFSAGTWSDGLGGPTGLGTNYCAAAVNSTGVIATMSAIGSATVADNDVTLTSSDMPLNTFGFFLNSMTQGFVPNPGGSDGNLCLGGGVGRYVGMGQIQSSGPAGEINLAIDLTSHPIPTGLGSVSAGETWNFTCWFRDSSPGGSNFANGLEIAFL